MSLKTDYKDEILRDGEDRRYNLVDENGRVVYSNIKLDKAYTPQQEGDEFNAKDVNEIHGRLNGLAPMNLLINGDFQCNQRGQSEYTNKSGNIVYTLDMWDLLWGTIKVLDKGIKIMPIDETCYFQQFIDTEIISNKVTICAKINDIVYTRTGTVSKTEPIILENENFNIVFQYVEDKYKVNLIAEKEVDVEYIDLFEGDIAYPHVKEDYATALMRCKDYIQGLDWGVIAYPLYMDDETSVFGVRIKKMKNVPTIQLIDIVLKNSDRPTPFTITSSTVEYQGDSLRIQFKHDTYGLRDRYVYLRILLTCEPI